MPTAKERLSHLLELAAQGREQRAALAGEVADLLLDWPAQYPGAMRATFGALLEKIVREVDAPAQAALAARFDGRSDFPPSLLNEFFLVATPRMQDAILAANDAAEARTPVVINAEALLAAARVSRDFASALAGIAGVPQSVSAAIACDARALAALCKGAGISRAAFSAMAILTGPVRSVHENFAMLTVFDRVPENGAAHLLGFWRARGEDAGGSMSEAAA
jgi:hypothetical protein